MSSERRYYRLVTLDRIKNQDRPLKNTTEDRYKGIRTMKVHAIKGNNDK